MLFAIMFLKIISVFLEYIRIRKFVLFLNGVGVGEKLQQLKVVISRKIHLEYNVHLYNLNLLIWNHVSIVFQDKVI
jgi:hypothetical protein